MDWNSISPKEIKQEDPVEYFLISAVSGGELNVELDTYSTNGGNFTESSLAWVKQEQQINVDDGDDELVDPLAGTSEKSETSEYEPDSEYDVNGEDNGTDTDNDYKTKKKSPKIKPTATSSSKFQISIIEDEDITFHGPPYTCNVCSLSFPIRKSLIAHRSIHKGKKFRCNLCKKVFRTKSHVYEHMKVHMEPRYSCPICSKIFALKKSFIHHRIIHEEKKFFCSVCDKPFRQKVHVKEHMKVHSERVRQFECEICDMAYYEKRTLTRHMKLAHSTMQRKRFRGPNTLCDKSYSSVPSFRMHACVNGKRPQELAQTNCALCDKRFFNNCEMKRHMKRAHNTIRPDNFQCDKCMRPFYYRYYGTFVQHVAQNCGKIFVDCDYCLQLGSGKNVQFDSKTKLIQHFGVVHGIECPKAGHSCPYCDKMFYNKNNLKYHLKKKHVEFKCIPCNKKFRTKGGHTIHLKNCILQKTFEKYSQQATTVVNYGTEKNASFACEICQCSFITEINLLEHMSEVHLEKNFQFKIENLPIIRGSKCVRKKEMCRYQCTICSSMFSRSNNLRKHLKTHSNNIERYFCDICDRSYASKPSIMKHFGRGDHRKSWQCEYCSIKLKRMSGYTKHLRYCKKKISEETEEGVMIL